MFLLPSQDEINDEKQSSDEEMSPVQSHFTDSLDSDQEEEEEEEEQQEGHTGFLDLIDDSDSVTSMIRSNFGDVTRIINSTSTRPNNFPPFPSSAVSPSSNSPSLNSPSPFLSPSEDRRKVRFFDPQEDALVSSSNYCPSPQASSPANMSGLSLVNTSSSSLLTENIENALSRHEESSMMSGLDLLGDDDDDDLDLMDQMASSNIRELLSESNQSFLSSFQRPSLFDPKL